MWLIVMGATPVKARDPDASTCRTTPQTEEPDIRVKGKAGLYLLFLLVSEDPPSDRSAVISLNFKKSKADMEIVAGMMIVSSMQ